MPRELMFTAYGVPVPKGSTRSFVIPGKDGRPPRAVTTAANPKTKGWQELIASAASDELQRARHAGTTFFDGSVELVVTFYLPRPQALLTKSKAGKAVAHVKKPDLDKLARSCKDALSRIVWHDDAQVTDLFVHKRYCAAGESPRAEIVVRDGPFPVESADRRAPLLETIS